MIKFVLAVSANQKPVCFVFFLFAVLVCRTLGLVKCTTLALIKKSIGLLVFIGDRHSTRCRKRKPQKKIFSFSHFVSQSEGFVE